MEFRTYLRHFDYGLLAAVCGLIVFGMLIIYSATHSDPGLPSPYYYVRLQAIAAAVGALLMLVLALIDFRGLRAYRWHMYAGIVGLIVLVFIMGAAVKGGQRWINLGFFQVQPSELAKVVMILVLSAFLADRQRGEPGSRTTLITIGYAMLPALLVFLQPDFGTMIVLVAVTLALLFVYGTRLLHFFMIAVVIGAGLVMVFEVLPHIGLHLLKSYQVDRLLVFLHPNQDPSGAGYNLLQSKIAIGSGMVTGQGLYQGTQTQLSFLPEHHTDFIFSVLGEELGFVGAAALLAMYAVVVWRGVRIAIISNSVFGSLIAAGVVAMLVFQIFVNIGMTIGIMPITGIPLPFMSYGGSSMVSNLLAVGLLESIHIRSQLTSDRRFRRAKIAR
ncbi:MAG: rod shape-determining protein RodA [Actinobacteria bacterium]|nr:rod shape-determining protein RodA [Actinomycetota bacterium]